MPERIQLRRTKGWRLGTNARSVARPSYFGNPYRIGDVYLVGSSLPFPMPTARSWEGPCGRGESDLRAVRCTDLATAVAWYELWAPLALEPSKVELLRGCDLACWCPLDQPCHADVLLRIANLDQGDPMIEENTGRSLDLDLETAEAWARAQADPADLEVTGIGLLVAEIDRLRVQLNRSELAERHCEACYHSDFGSTCDGATERY